MNAPSPVNIIRPLLEIKNVSVDYQAGSGTVHALTDVSLTLESGQILGLAGESGSGKSTLAYAITRLLKHPAKITGGEVIYYPNQMKKGAANVNHNGSSALNPVDVLKLTPQELRGFRWTELAIVFQSAMNALNPVLDVGTQIMDVFRAHRPEMTGSQRRSRAAELLRLVGISADRLKSFPHELSGGMRQRAIIAIALALSPEIIVMDEPTTALDVVVQREILMEIIALRRELDFSVIFITHDLSLLLELADKVAIMYAGRVVETTACSDLKAHPRHPYSYGMLNSFPRIHGERRRMTGIPGSPPDLRDIPSGCAFHPRCPLAFEACKHDLPLLRTSALESPHQLVACHLYDPKQTSAPPPTNAAFAAKYEEAYLSAKGRKRGR